MLRESLRDPCNQIVVDKSTFAGQYRLGLEK